MNPRIRWTSKGLYWVEGWGAGFGEVLIGPFDDWADITQWREEQLHVHRLAREEADRTMARFLRNPFLLRMPVK